MELSLFMHYWLADSKSNNNDRTYNDKTVCPLRPVNLQWQNSLSLEAVGLFHWNEMVEWNTGMTFNHCES